MAGVPTLPIFFPTGSLGWFIVNFSYDMILGTGAFVLLVYLVPMLQHASRTFTYPDRKGIIRYRPVHPRIFRWFAFLQIITLVAVLWGIFIMLIFSVGWKNPFTVVNWYGVQAPGWLFDLIYSRANNQPDGAHILSWLCCAMFGLAVWYRTIPRPVTRFHQLMGNPFLGIAGLVFIGAIHEIMWVGFYYSAYWQYLDWSLLLEVLRDVSFGVMMVLFIFTFWKHPKRTIPLTKFKNIIMVYLVFLVAWFLVPALFGQHFLPITTLNNPKWGAGLYEETPFFSYWWVNAIEVISWLILCIPSIIVVLRYKEPITDL